jgi:hypothetical protein
MRPMEQPHAQRGRERVKGKDVKKEREIVDSEPEPIDDVTERFSSPVNKVIPFVVL